MKTWRELTKGLTGEDLKQNLKFAFFTGILAHGMALFNKLSWRNDLDRGFVLHDEKALTLGRWLKVALNDLVGSFFNGRNLSLPLVHGLVALLFIALSAHLIIRTFDIRHKSLKRAVIGMMVAFPVVASTFGYMYCAPYYFLALLLAVFAVYVASQRPKWDAFAVSALCLACCLGIYQAFFPVAVSLFVSLLILEIARDRHESISKTILRGFYFLGTCVAGLVLFFVIWKIVLAVSELSANSHMGMASIGKSGVKEYLKAILKTYKCFVMDFSNSSENIYPMGLAWVQWILIAICGICAAGLVIRRFRKDVLQAVAMILLIAILPLCFNLVYVMAASTPDDGEVYALMLYGQCMFYVFLIGALDLLCDEEKKLYTAFRRVGVAALAFMICLNVYFDNSCYLKAQIVLEQTISDFTVMIARIKSLEGYNDTMPVCLIEEGSQDKTFPNLKPFRDLLIEPFDWIHPYAHTTYALDFMEKWCGFKPKHVSEKKFAHNEEVKAMTIYPDDGSIKIIDGTVVIKW